MTAHPVNTFDLMRFLAKLRLQLTARELHTLLFFFFFPLTYVNHVIGNVEVFEIFQMTKGVCRKFLEIV